ncbi:MAG: S8 family serine peptidase, partial [Pseudomonadota bacterium]
DDDDNSGGDRDVLDDEIVALGLPAFSAADRNALEDAGFAVIAQNTLPGLGGEVLRLALPLGIRPEEGVQIASALVPGAIFDKNDLYGTNEGDCTGANCWAATAVGMARAPRPSCYRGSPIAIIDTAVDPGHPALRGTRITRRSFVPTGATASGSDHGTTIAAILVGDLGPDLPPLAPGARLLVAEAVQDIDGRALADTVAVIRGLDWAISSRSRVVAMSLAGGENRALERAIRTVAGRINIVAAAGNGGPRSAPVYPAAYPEVLAVSAVDRRLRPYRNGNRGGYIDIAAPGVGVVSAGGGATRAWSGTSFAVPYVAAALLRARALTNGDAAAAQALLLSSARDLGPPGPDEVYGHGLVQSPGDRCW